MNVLLIGNSDINRDKKYGDKIDEFDLVIRMNRYRILEYEEYLGTKTNVWVLNRAISLGKSRVRMLEIGLQDETHQRLIQDYPNLFGPNRVASGLLKNLMPGNSSDVIINTKFQMNQAISKDLDTMLMVTYVDNQKELVDLHNKIQKHKGFKVADTFGVSQYLRSRWDELIDKSFYKPATGLLAIHYFLEKYDRIYLHNFDCGKSKHYWGDTDSQSEPMSSKHDWSFDEILIDELIKSKKVSYL